MRSGKLLRELRHLGDVQAPLNLLPAVLECVGLGDAYTSLETPMGSVFVAYSTHGVSAVMRATSARAFESAFRGRFGRSVRQVPELPASLAHMIHRPWRRERQPLPPIDLRQLSAFGRAVLRKVLEIPRGEVRPYAWVAREIGQPKAVRAVGAVLARNPVPLLIPCHRVVRSDGDIGEYLFGKEAKRQVLLAEGIDLEGMEHLARTGVRYYGSDTTRIYCFPTCRNARRIIDRHRVPFSSELEAAEAGYRPCSVCRPARAS